MRCCAILYLEGRWVSRKDHRARGRIQRILLVLLVWSQWTMKRVHSVWNEVSEMKVSEAKIIVWFRNARWTSERTLSGVSCLPCPRSEWESEFDQVKSFVIFQSELFSSVVLWRYRDASADVFRVLNGNFKLVEKRASTKPIWTWPMTCNDWKTANTNWPSTTFPLLIWLVARRKAKRNGSKWFASGWAICDWMTKGTTIWRWALISLNKFERKSKRKRVSSVQPALLGTK